MGTANRLTNASQINWRWDCSRENWELGDGVEGSHFFACAVKFPLEIEDRCESMGEGGKTWFSRMPDR